MSNGVSNFNFLAVLLSEILGGPKFTLGGPKPPKISETTRARMLKFKIQLDIVKYSLWVKIFLR